jgi:glycosyltransferase involved in cell wall biosynthesis
MQRHSRLLAEQLTKRGNVNLTVLHPHKDQVFDPTLGINEIHIQGIDTSRFYLAECYRYSRRVAEALDQLPADSIIYAQGLSVWADIKRFSHRLILNPHGLEAFQVIGLKENIIGLPFRRIFRYLFRRSNITVSLGGKLTEILKNQVKGSPSEVVVLPNAVAEKRREDAAHAEGSVIRVMFAGRFAHNKGIGTLFEAIERLQSAGKLELFEFHLIGKGPLFDHYQAINTYPNVLLHGFVSDEELEQQYRLCDIFLLPTWFEGMPTVVLEAMSYAKPVIVTDVGAAAELVDNRNGYLIQARDSKAVTKSLEAFEALPKNERIKMGEQGYQKVQERFTWDKVAQMHEQVFESLLPRV